MDNMIDSGLIFEEVVMDIIKRICIKNKKNLFYEYEKNKISFDAIAPQGLYDNIQTLIEIKYTASKKNIMTYLDNYFNEFRNEKVKILLFTLLDKEDEDFIDSYLKIKKITNIIILGKEEVFSMISDNPLDFYKLEYAKVNNNVKYNDLLNEFEFFKINETLKEELRELLNKNKVTLILGTGVSFDFKVLNWSSLIQFFYDNLKEEAKFLDKESAFRKIGDDNYGRAQYIKQSMTESSYMKTLYQSLYMNYQNIDIKDSFTLVKISNIIKKKNIKKIITYNYDNYLEIVLNMNNVIYKSMISNEDSLDDKLPIYHVHGYFPYDCSKEEQKQYLKNVILTEDEYFRLYNDSSNWQVAIQLESFKDDICLFIGNSITDFNEKKLLNCTKQKFKKHYAIFCRDELSVNDMARINAYFRIFCNVEIIWVDRGEDIPKFLQDL